MLLTYPVAILLTNVSDLDRSKRFSAFAVSTERLTEDGQRYFAMLRDLCLVNLCLRLVSVLFGNRNHTKRCIL